MSDQTETFTEQDEADIEERMNGMDAGRAFADRHILEKITLFSKVYRDKKYSESFIEGFVDGINEVIGSSIYLHDNAAQGEESDTEVVDSQQ